MISEKDLDSFSIYLTPRTKQQLAKVAEYGITIVEAPTGFGKTTVMKNYSLTRATKVDWIDVRSTSKDIFWEDLCDIVTELSADLGRQLQQLGYPQSEKNVAELRSAIKNNEIVEDFYIFIDNYQNIGDVYFDMLLDVISEYMSEYGHLIIITQALPSMVTFDMTIKKTVLHITKDDLEFMPEDIIGFFACHDIKIPLTDASSLYEFSEGWISAIYLQMINYSENHTLDNCITIDKLVEKSVWLKMSISEKYLMISLSRIDGFTLREAKDMTDDNDMINSMEDILSSNLFIKFDQKSRCFYMHHIFVQYLIDRFNDLSVSEQREIIKRTGQIYEERGIIVEAYKQYYGIGDWDSIYRTTPSFADLYAYLNKENKDFFMSLIFSCPQEIRDKYQMFTIIMCLVLFMYSEKERLVEYLMDIVFSIEENKNMPERLRKNLLGTVYYIRGYTAFNNISVMNDFYRKSLEYAGSPVLELTANIPWTIGCPSVLHIFHRENECLNDEINDLNECMPNYYRLSDGHGKGAEALMMAEAFFNQGNLKDAEILSHKALYMADSRNQKCILLCDHLLLTRLSVFEGEYTSFHDNMEMFDKKLSRNDDQSYNDMIDMCRGFIYAQLDEKDKIAEWLRNWDSIEERLNLISISFANIIYGKWLLLEGEYEKFLGISGQFLGIANIYSMAMPKIYTYIYICMANEALSDTEKAIRMLDEALQLAQENNILMPFVENYGHIGEFLDNLELTMKHREFIKEIKNTEKNYARCVKSIIKNVRNKTNFGLTSRELDVAKLAAERYSNKEIAEKLYIAESTVKSNLKIIFNKLDISSRTELCNFF